MKKFSCEKCLYSTDSKQHFESHKKSKTHFKKENNIFESNYQCVICSKTYRSNLGYYSHRKKCIANRKVKDEEEIEKKKKDDDEKEEMRKIVIDLYKQNTEMKTMLVELSKKEFITKVENIDNSQTTNTNSHNKIKIDIFLNEKCKNAMNMSSLIESIVIGIKDIENIEKFGYVKTITNIIAEKLGDYSLYERPLHYIENKELEDEEVPNDTIHIKENNKWNIENLSEHDVLLENMNEINSMFQEKTKENENANQVVKQGRRYDRTGKVITNILEKVKINKEDL